MIKLNSKGFMMAEVIIVSTVILSTLVGLYTIFNKMYIVYTERSYYYNVDAVYAGESIYKYLVSNKDFVEIIKDGGIKELITVEKDENENDIYSCGDIEEDICKGLIDTYKIKSAIIFPYNNTAVNKDNSNVSNFDVRFKDYLDYLNTSLNFEDEFNYIIIVELENGDYQYFGYYRIR